MSSDKATALLSSYTFPLELHVDELLVRMPRVDDVDTIAPAFLDPEVGGAAGMPPLDAEQLRLVLETQIPRMRDGGLLSPYLIVDADGTILGGAALHHLDPMRDVVELGYWLFRHGRGRGVATRVVTALVEDAFTRGIHRVEAVVRIGNEASERVLARAGFTREGIRRGLLRHDGQRVDATLFSRLADDPA